MYGIKAAAVSKTIQKKPTHLLKCLHAGVSEAEFHSGKASETTFEASNEKKKTIPLKLL